MIAPILKVSYDVYQDLMDALEDKNNLITVIQRIAFGFRTFKHLRQRILVQQMLIDII